MVNNLLLVISIVLVYASLFNASLLNWDDPNHLINNSATVALSIPNLIMAFTQPVQQVYMPLTTLSFAIERHFFGLNPVVYHGVNILLHIINSFLVLSIGKRLGFNRNVALMAAFIFALHPMRVESVAWVTERKDVLCAVFYFLGLRQYLIYVKSPSIRTYVLTVMYTLLALLAKPMAISMGLMFAVIDWYMKRPLGRAVVLEKLPILILSAAIGYLTYMHHQRWPIEDVGVAVLSFAYTSFFYIKQFFIPYPLTPLHVLPPMQGMWLGVYGLCLMGWGIIIYSVWRWRHHRYWLLALGMYVAGTFFLFRYDPTHDINVVADRFMYIPGIGLCFWLAWVMREHQRWLMVLLFGYAVLSGVYAYQWKDDRSIYSWAIKVNPSQTIAYNNRAGYFLGEGEYDLALEDYNKVLSLKPLDADTLFNRALTYQRMNEHALAVDDFNVVLKQYPSYARGFNQRGISYAALGEYEQAIDDYTQSLAIEPNDAKVYFNRGLALQKLNRIDEAITDYSQAIARDGSMAKAYNNRGVLYVKQERYVQARDDFMQALRLDPEAQDAIFNLNMLNKIQQ